VTLQEELRRDYGDFSRARQEPQLKKLNQLTYRTYSAREDAARRLIESWYGGADADGNLVGNAFDDSTTVAGWRNGEVVPDPSPGPPGRVLTNPATTEELYHSVYTRHCRMCHTNMPDGPLRFDTYQEFIAQRDAIRHTVFRAGTMPGARLTMDRFWVPFDGGTAPGELLASHVAAVLGEPPDSPPGAAVAEIIGLDPAPRRGDIVYLDGGNSTFAQGYSWSLLAPVGSAARLSARNARHTAFVADVPGTYEVALTINEGAADEATAVASVTLANRAPTAVDDLSSLDLVTAATLQGSLFAGAFQDSDPDGDALTAALAPGGAPSHGTVTIGGDGAFVYTYAGGAPAPDADTFRYEVTDGFGAAAQATVTVLLNDAPGAARPTPVAAFTATDASTQTGGNSVSRVALSFAAATDDQQVVGYNVYRDGTLLAHVPSTAPPGSNVSYTDSTVGPGAAHAYRVTALDGANESAPSQERAVSVATSLRRNIQTGWGTGTESLWQATGCIGCHRGAAGGLTLAGTPDEVFAELHESATDIAAERVEVAEPLRSLLLCKPLIKSDPRSCPHEGGAFLASSDPRFKTLLGFVQALAPNN
jgi:hypothetical protein